MSTTNHGNITIGGDANLSFGGGSVVQRIRDAGPRRDSGADGVPERQNATDLAADRCRNVFVIHGRDSQVREAAFGLLRALDLRPLEWEALVHSTREGSPFLGRVIADAPLLAQAALVLLSPDDVVMLHPGLRSMHEDRFELWPALQPRPNVMLELGMVLAVYAQNTIIVEFGDLRPTADLAGRNIIHFNEAVSLPEALRKISGRLKTAGCLVDDSGTDWLDVRPFTTMKAYRRRPA
jgi:predicted nucleotide-binding protein